MRHRLLLAAQGLGTILLLALLFRDFEWAAFRALFAQLPLSFYLLSLAAVMAGQLLYAWRWRALLVAAGVRVPFHRVLTQHFIGVFLNNFLPSTVGGDAAKVYYLGRGHGYGPVTASVVLDRVLGLGLLAVLATATLWMQPPADPAYRTARVVITALALACAAAIAIAAGGHAYLPLRLASGRPRLAALAATLGRARGIAERAVRSPAVWLQAATAVVVYFLLIALVYRVFIQMQAGPRLPFAGVLMAVTTTSVLSSVPITINGLGLREQLHVLLLAPLGVSREAAVAISLLMFGHLLLGSLAGGVLWLQVSRRSGVAAG
ncbi:MAG: lysylphosphatidylglycerol synthase transmembrane domain-containing protein [Vicinamibacterales bacterium]